MPAIAWALAVSLGLPAAAAVGLVMVGCLPGGSTSNMFAYFARGEVALSITMTAVSTLLALVLMPLTLGYWTAGWVPSLAEEHGGFVIPFGAIAATLALVLVPVIGGMFLRVKSPGWAKVAEDTAGFVGFLVIIFLIISWLAREANRARMAETPWGIYVAVIGLGLVGFAFGHTAARAVGCPPRQRRTVALETGIQNAPLAFAIIVLSFNGPLVSELLWVPICYALFIVGSSSVTTLVMRRIGYRDWAEWQNSRVQERLLIGPSPRTQNEARSRVRAC
jgi:BASS family bile acid:Na+ symporter